MHLSTYNCINGRDRFARRFIGDGNDMVSILFSDFQMNRAAKSTLFFCDATFKVPRGFRQLWNIMIFCEDTSTYVSVAHFLMKSKSLSNYVLALGEWQSMLKQQEAKLEPLCFTCDFELAEMRAVQKVFKCDIVGDSFHFSKALLKKIKKDGLFSKVYYTQDLKFFTKYYSYNLKRV